MIQAYPIWTVPPDRRAEVPHHSARPGWPEIVDTLVIHYTADSPSGKAPPKAIRWWRDPRCPGASAHYVIERDGTVWQAVPLDRSAWHVYTPGWNARSIGIELANMGPPEEFPPAQIAALVALITELRRDLHPRGGWRLIGHEDVQGNRSDPGPLFPWESMPLPKAGQ